MLFIALFAFDQLLKVKLSKFLVSWYNSHHQDVSINLYNDIEVCVLKVNWVRTAINRLEDKV
jgi:hypothetical protein